MAHPCSALTGIAKYTSLSAKREDFVRILNQHHCPPVFVQVLFGNNGQYAHFIEFEDAINDGVPSHICMSIQGKLFSECSHGLTLVNERAIVLQCPHSPLKSFCCHLRLRLSDRSTTCLLIDQDETRIDNLIESLRLRKQRLQLSPIHIISILAESYGHRTERWRANLDHSIVDMEKHIGMTGFQTDALVDIDDNFEPLTNDLHIANTSLIWLDCMTNFEHALSTFGDEMTALCEQLRTEKGLTPLSWKERTLLAQETRFNQKDCEFRQYQVKGLQLRVQTQINIVR